MVIGSSQGIGRSYALELAARGLNIVLVARNKERLSAVAKEIEEKYNVQTKIIDIDFANEKDIQGRIEAETKVYN